jgi:hypothetical protein
MIDNGLMIPSSTALKASLSQATSEGPNCYQNQYNRLGKKHNCLGSQHNRL